MRKKFLNQPQHIIKSQRHAHNVFLEGERSNKNTAVLSPKKKILSQINAEIFMLKKRELIKNADSRSTAAKLKVQPKRQNKKISFAGGKNAPTRTKSYRGKHSAIL